MTECQEFRISVQGLDIDMFVSRLDRPWLDTSFPLEGLRIRSQQDIDQLQRVCTHVFVDPTRGRSPDLRFVEMRSLSGSVGLEATGLDLPEFRHNRWVVLSEFSAELPEATRAANALQRSISEVMRDLQNGHVLEVRKLRAGIEAMVDSITRNPTAFTWLMELKRKDEYIYRHALGCAVWAATLGRHLGLEKSDLQDLALGGLLLDVGKTQLPPDLLVKRSPLVNDDLERLRHHVHLSLDILGKAQGLPFSVLEMVAHHHERHDGSGYPKGLVGGDIPIGSRIMGLVDSYDAMTCPRPYASARSPHQAMMQLYEARDVLFQAELVEQFIQVCGIYPTGSLVELTDGRVGVVMEVHSLKRLRPSVMLLLDADKKPMERFRRIDLSEELTDAEGRSLDVRCGLPAGAYGIDPKELFLD